MQQLDPHDALYAYFEHDALPLQIVAAFIFDLDTVEAEVTATALGEDLAARAAGVPKLGRRLQRVPMSLDYPYWVPDVHYVPENHVRLHDAGGESWEYLRTLLQDVARDPLDMSMPPWEVHIVSGLRDIDGVANATALVLKVHHAMGDGLESVEILRSLLSESPAVPAGEGAALLRREAVPSRTSLALEALRRQPRKLADLVAGIRDVAAASREVTDLASSGAITLPQPKRPRTRFNRRPHRTRTFDAARFTIDEVRSAKVHLPGATVNDVMLTTVSRALELYLGDKGEAPGANLAALVPMSTRSMLEKASANQFDPLIVDLYNLEPNLRQRCIAIAKHVRTDKQRDLNASVQRSRSLIRYLPAQFQAGMAFVNKRWRDGGTQVALSNTMITNVKRGQADFQLGGARVVSTYGLPALDASTSLTHGIYSVGELLSICFVSDDDALPDPQEYKRLLRVAFDEVAAALGRIDPDDQENSISVDARG